MTEPQTRGYSLLRRCRLLPPGWTRILARLRPLHGGLIHRIGDAGRSRGRSMKALVLAALMLPAVAAAVSQRTPIWRRAIAPSRRSRRQRSLRMKRRSSLATTRP
jgi:hypothetical protein